MKNYINSLIKKYKIKSGYIDCPFCKEFIKPKLIKDWICHPEEPPLFFHYECPKCTLWISTFKPSILTEKAVRQLGFKRF